MYERKNKCLCCYGMAWQTCIRNLQIFLPIIQCISLLRMFAKHTQSLNDPSRVCVSVCIMRVLAPFHVKAFTFCIDSQCCVFHQRLTLLIGTEYRFFWQILFFMLLFDRIYLSFLCFPRHWWVFAFAEMRQVPCFKWERARDFWMLFSFGNQNIVILLVTEHMHIHIKTPYRMAKEERCESVNVCIFDKRIMFFPFTIAFDRKYS